MSLHALILAGGQSRRMGRDKAQLTRPDGQTQLEFTVELARSVASTVLVSRRERPATPEPWPVLIDRWAGEGPLGAILTAQTAESGADWLVLACDLPRLNLEILTHLIAAQQPEDLAVAYRSAFDGLPEPLCAIYRPGIRAEVERRFTEGLRCPRKVLIQTPGVRLLDLPSPEALDNANTPAEWEAATR